MKPTIHSTSEISATAKIGDGTKIWLHCQIRDYARLGENCILGKGVFVDTKVTIGDNVKIQNYSSIYEGVTLEDGVFVGPHVCFTNDRVPRAINPDGTLKAATDWAITPTLIHHGASLGANSTIICGVTIGEWAMIGAGSTVTRNIPPHGLAWGNPARLKGFVCKCGAKLEKPAGRDDENVTCGECGEVVNINPQSWNAIA
jgi:acetyltransferase-like isoleucine patch superfamily enzyme